MSETISRLPQVSPAVNPKIDLSKYAPWGGIPQGNVVSPSLVLMCQNSASGEWSKKQKRNFMKLNSFMKYCHGCGFKLFTVHLTSSPQSDFSQIRENLQEVIRRYERLTGATVYCISLKTGEGYGVLHCVWAVDTGGQAGWIDQAWLSAEWKKIHQADRVWVARINNNKKHARNVSSYYVSQYYAGNDKLFNFTYSWKKLGFAIVQGWDYFKKRGGYALSKLVSGSMYRKALIEKWNELLLTDQCIVGNINFLRKDANITHVYL